jgi:hypothetical protein
VQGGKSIDLDVLPFLIKLSNKRKHVKDEKAGERERAPQNSTRIAFFFRNFYINNDTWESAPPQPEKGANKFV